MPMFRRERRRRVFGSDDSDGGALVEWCRCIDVTRFEWVQFAGGMMCCDCK
jgi:hypothetical protein